MTTRAESYLYDACAPSMGTFADRVLIYSTEVIHPNTYGPQNELFDLLGSPAREAEGWRHVCPDKIEMGRIIHAAIRAVCAGRRFVKVPIQSPLDSLGLPRYHYGRTFTLYYIPASCAISSFGLHRFHWSVFYDCQTVTADIEGVNWSHHDVDGVYDGLKYFYGVGAEDKFDSGAALLANVRDRQKRHWYPLPCIGFFAPHINSPVDDLDNIDDPIKRIEDVAPSGFLRGLAKLRDQYGRMDGWRFVA